MANPLPAREAIHLAPSQGNALLSLLHRVRDLGIVPGLDDDLARHVRVTNLATVFLWLMAVPYFYIYWSLGLYTGSYFVAVLSLFYAGALACNAFRRYDASRILLITSVNVAVCSYSAILGLEFGIQYVLYFCLIGPFMLFHIRERWKLMVTVAQPVIIWILLHGPFGLVSPARSPEVARSFYFCITTTTAMMIGACAFLIYWLHHRSLEQLRLAKDEAEKSNRAKSEFLATISHEIRTPMNGILGAAQLLALSPMTPKQKSFLDIVVTSGNLLLAIINDILDFSKIESGRLELESVRVDLEALLGEVIALHRTEADIKGLFLRLERREGCPAEFLGDPTRLRQAALNLVSNAVKFTSKGGVTVSLSRLSEQGGRVRVAIAVEDTGIGIPADKLDRIFKPFSQADSSTTRQYGGTGLGLAIVRRLAGLMDGELTLNTREGVGSTFTFIASLGAALHK